MSVTNGNSAGFQRLPTKVIPIHYDLTFEPDWSLHTFAGSAVIDVEVKETTNVLVLNAVNFSINGIKVKEQANGGEQEAELFIMDKEQELLKINLATPLLAGLAQLRIDYEGKVNDNLKGFFRSKYQGPKGDDRFHFLTYFEPTFARWCFPGWDEPSFKSTFDVTLIVPKHLVAVSNMPVKADTPHPTNIDKKVVKYERTVKMSTYLVAFAIGEFDYVESSTPEGILCRVYTPVGRKERGNFALDVVMKSLAYYTNYFGISYPLPKMDLLAVTEFPIGAMENFGLVTYREQLLLMDEKLSSAITKQHVAIVVAHETSHMWFGNLVTMDWWSDLWLKEGYATFMEFSCVDSIYPEFQIWNIFMGDYIQALQEDAAATSHPIQVTVKDPAEIGAIFDSISYDKGASVIRMLYNYLGEEKFREGMAHYLNQHLYGNAETKDLWAALSEKSGEKVDVIMSTFTEQMGYPVFTVQSVEQVGQEKIITLRYEKFWLNSDARKSGGSTEYNWISPITVRKQSDPTGVVLKTLVHEKAGVEFKIQVNASDNEWIKLNADHVGYYRVTYSSSVLENFIPSIRSKEMQPLDRLGILNDLFANVKAGHACSDDVLKFILAYENEDVHPVWSCILGIVSAFQNLLGGTALEEKFKGYAQTLLSPIKERLGWDSKENEAAQDAVLRSALLTKMVGLGCANTIEEGKSRFAQNLRGDATIAPDVRSAVYRAAASEGESGFEALLKIYRSTDLLEEKVRIISAFGAIKDKAVIRKVLEFGRSGEVNTQDIITILVSLSDQGNQEISWEYFKENWEFFRDRFPTGGGLIRRVVDAVTAGFKVEERALEVEAFFQEHQIKGIERTLSQATDNIRTSSAWLERDFSPLEQFLATY